MRHFVRNSDVVEDGMLLREEPGEIPEVLKRRSLEWTPTPSLYQATFMTDDWNEISEDEARRIEAHQRAMAAKSP